MTEDRGKNGRFLPGKSGNLRGRPRGLVEKRARVTKALLKDAEQVAQVVSAAAQGGDMTAAGMVLDRAVPALKREGSLVRFPFNPDASLAEQFNQLMHAIANGQLTIEEGQRVADMLRARAEIAALEGKGGEVEKLVEAFKTLAQNLPT